MRICVSLHLSGSVNVLVNTKEKDKSCLFLILSEPFDLSVLVLAAAWLFFLICKLQSQSEVKTLDKDRLRKTVVTGICDGKKQRSWLVEYCVFLATAGGEIICLLDITFPDLNVWYSCRGLILAWKCISQRNEGYSHAQKDLTFAAILGSSSLKIA